MTFGKRDTNDLYSALQYAIADRESLLDAYSLPDGTYMKGYAAHIRSTKALIQRYRKLVQRIEEMSKEKSKPSN